MNPSAWAHWFEAHYQFLETATAVVAVVILISSVDDLFIDAWYWVRELYRKLRVRPRHQALTAEQIRARPEQPLAIMVPAWREHEVIAAMLENMARTLEYRNYRVFVGTYPNDERTIAEVERLRQYYPHLVRVEVPHDGPTCKADCLNAIYQEVEAQEERQSEIYAGIVIHDSEDVLHPLELKYYNYLLPRIDFIQLPVISLERNATEWIAGTYMDEFAEWHGKDLVVRESLSHMVPSAGVATCFSRRALHALARQTDAEPFNTETLTEDYDVGARLSRMGMRQIFGRFDVQYRVQRKSWFGLGPVKKQEITHPLGVREYFPNTFRAAYRQKARWTLGIGFQGWQQVGWKGSLAVKYLLFRDRKGLLTSFVTVVAYVLFFNYMLFLLLDRMGWWSSYLPPSLEADGWLRNVMWFNAFALVMRVVQRVYFVGRLYGWEHGVLAVPRMVVGNFVNAMAAARAWRLFLAHILLGRPLVWNKTLHDFPSTQALAGKHQRLGELLTAWQAIDANQLNEALQDPAFGRQPLGHILMRKGWLDEETLAEALAYQSALPRTSLDEARVRAGSVHLPIDTAIQLRALALPETTSQVLHLAVVAPLSESALETLRQHAGRKVQQAIACESDIAQGLRLLRGVPQTPGEPDLPLLGDVLIEEGLVTRERFDRALMDYRSDEDGLIGAYLVRRGVLTQAALERALALRSAATKPKEIQP